MRLRLGVFDAQAPQLQLRVEFGELRADQFGEIGNLILITVERCFGIGACAIDDDPFEQVDARV